MLRMPLNNFFASQFIAAPLNRSECKYLEILSKTQKIKESEPSEM